MGKKNKAVIDLGSNTFHVIIADENNQIFSRNRHFVALSEHGIEEIGQPAIERGARALKEFKALIKKHQATRSAAVGTSALRSAKNGKEVQALFESIIGMDIQIIDGNREADLIFKGVKLLMNETLLQDTSLIMDIGGGSTEFILHIPGMQPATYSFDLGGGTLYSAYHREEPFNEEKWTALTTHLDRTLEPLKNKIANRKLKYLIGSSGTFETLVAREHASFDEHQLHLLEKSSVIDFMNELIHADYEERASYPFIGEKRARLIPVSYALVLYVLEHLAPEQIFMSPYALKEGLLSELI